MIKQFKSCRDNEMSYTFSTLEYCEMRDDELLQGYVGFRHGKHVEDPLMMVFYTWKEDTSEYDIQIARQDALSSLKNEFNKWLDKWTNTVNYQSN